MEPDTSPEVKFMFNKNLEPGYYIPTAVQTDPDLKVVCYSETGQQISLAKVAESNSLDNT